MPILRAIATAMSLAMAGLPAAAQTWQGFAQDSGAFVTAAAHAPEHSLSMFCNTPSRGGVNPLATGEHEMQATQPFQFVLRFSTTLADPRITMVLDRTTLTLDGTGYRMPPIQFDEFWGDWSIYLNMADPMVRAMLSAEGMIFDPGLGTAFAYPVDGLRPALEQMLTVCTTSWALQGHLPPAEIGMFLGHASSIPAVHPYARMQAELYRVCQGPFRLDPDSVTETDLDRDGMDDVTVFYGGAECLTGTAGYGAGYCGASQCLTQTFLSTRQGGADFDLYAQGVVTDLARPGQLGLVARLRVCQDLQLPSDCTMWHVWQNNQMQRIN